MMTQRVHSRLLTTTKAFYLIQCFNLFIFSLFFITPLILACLKSLGNNM